MSLEEPTTPFPAAPNYDYLDLLSPEELMQNAIQVMMKPKKARELKDIAILMKCTQNVKFFQSVIEKKGTEVHRNLCQNIDHIFLKKNDIVFEAGSIGKTFYIILTGTVDVWIRKKDEGQEGQEKVALQKVAEIPQGGSFGELAIMDAVLKPRSATIQCKEDCHFLVLDRDIYKQVLGDDEKRELDATIEFLRLNPLFKVWSAYALRSWVALFRRREKFQRNAIIYREKDKAEDIYLIRSGQVLSTKAITMQERQEGDESLVLDDEDHVIAVARSSKIKKKEIAIFGPGEIIGEEESYQAYKAEAEKAKRDEMKRSKSAKKIVEKPLPSRETTMIALSPIVELWIIPAKAFFPKLELNGLSIQHLTSIITGKRNRREQRIRNIQKSSADYMNYLQKEPNGQRNVISRLSKAVPPSAQQQQKFEMQIERTQIRSSSKPASRERSLNSSFNTLDQINTSQISPNASPRKSSNHGGRSPDKSPDTVRTRRATVLDLIPLQRTQSSVMVGLKSSTRENKSSTIIESRMNASGDETSRSKRISNGNLLEQIMLSGVAGEEKSTTSMKKSITISLKRKKSASDYARTTSHLKLRIQQKLEEGKSISQNDHLYANIINQYNTFRPDQVFAALKQKVESEPPGDIVQRMEAARQEANNQVYRLHKKQEVATTEHVTSQMEKLAKSVQIKSNSFFNNRNRLIASDDDKSESVKKALHEAQVKGGQGQTPRSARPGTHHKNNPYGFEGDSSRVDQNTSRGAGGNKSKRPLTERSRPKTGVMNSSAVSNPAKFIKPEKKRKYFVEKKRDASVENLTTEGSVEGSRNVNAMFSYINEEVRRLKENSDKQEGYHSKFRLFNYVLWELYGDRPRQNALLRRIELSERNKMKEKLEDSPVKNLKVQFNTRARTYSLSPTKRNL